MAWEVVKPKAVRFGGDTVRFSMVRDKGKPRVKIVFGSEVMVAMKWKLGDFIQVVFNRESLQLGFQKSKNDAYKLCGKHRSGCITIGMSDNGVVSRILTGITKAGEQKPTIEKSLLVVNCREFVM